MLPAGAGRFATATRRSGKNISPMSTTQRPSISLAAVVVVCLVAIAFPVARAFAAGDEPPVPVRPKVPGTLRLHLRERKAAPADAKPAAPAQVVERTVDWDVSKTA